MTALAAAVIPIIRLLVAVATRSGTPIARCISGTLIDPAADAEQGRDDPRAGRPDDPEAQAVDAVALAGQALSAVGVRRVGDGDRVRVRLGLDLRSAPRRTRRAS